MPAWDSLRDGLDQTLFDLGATGVTPMSLLVLAATILIAVVLGMLARRAIDAFFRRRTAAREGLGYAVGRITQYLIVLGSVLVGLHNIGIDMTALAAGGAIVAVGLGIGLQNIAQNFVSGVILLVERPVQKGDFVIVGNTVGTVQEIAMRATRVVSRDGVSIIVPNSELVSARVINQSAPTSTYRVRIAVGVAYGSDTERVRQALLEVAERHPAVLDHPAPVVYFRDFGDSALLFELAVWLDDPRPEPAVTSDLRFAIDRAFRERDVVIAFPQLDLHLKTGFEQVLGRMPSGKRLSGPGAEAPRHEQSPVADGGVRDTSAMEVETIEGVVREKDHALDAGRQPGKRDPES